MMFFLHWGRPRHSPHYSNGAPWCLLTFIIDRQSWPQWWQWVRVYQLFIRLQYVGSVQAIGVVIRWTTWTLQCNHKANVSLVPLKRCKTCTLEYPCTYKHIHNIKCSQAAMEMWRPPCLMSWFRLIQCTHAIATGHIHTYTSTWYVNEPKIKLTKQQET